MACLQYNPRLLTATFGATCTCRMERNNRTCISEMESATMGSAYNAIDDFPIDSWVRLKQIPIEAHPNCEDFDKCMPAFHKYMWALFMSTSQMLCIGYGQFPPQTYCGMLFTMLGMFFGSIIWALLLGNITSTLQTLHQDNTQFK